MRETKNRDHTNRLTVIKVKVIPRSSRNQIVGFEGDTLKVKVTAPPVDGKANRAVIEVIAGHLGIPKKDIRMISGEHSRQKFLEIRGVSREDILLLRNHFKS